MATEDPIIRQQDKVNVDHRYRGFLYDLQQPRIPITGPIGFRSDDRKFPLPSSLVPGNPVFPPKKAKGFFFGSDNIRDLSGEERRENRINLRLLDKSSAEVRRSQRAADEQAEFLKLHREAKQREELKRRKEQEDDLNQLKTYFPFGKSGYGAPRSGNLGRSKKIGNAGGVGLILDNDTPPPRVDWKKTIPPGAPGRPKVRRYEDDRMRRYAVSPETAMAYKQELDELQAIKKQNEEKVKSLDAAREKDTLDYNPFGKPGAGAPNRDDKGRMSMRRSISFSYMNNPVDARHAEKVRERKDSEQENESTDENDGRPQVGRRYRQTTPTSKNQPPSYDPWGKDQPRIDSRGNARRFPRAGDNGIYEFIDPNVPGEVFPRKHIGGGGEPLLGDDGEKITKRMGNLTTIHGARRSENIPRVATPEQVRGSLNTKSPWGKPGAGAPLKDEEGNVVKNTKGRINKEHMNLTQSEASKRVRAKELYRSQLHDGMILQRQLRDQEKEFLMRPPGDVPSWFSKGKVGRPTRDPETGLIQPQKRVMSDVTAQKLAADRPRDVETYYRELKEQAEERHRMRLKEKERVAQLEAKHFPNFNSFFRKPGHGAPKGDGVNARRKFSTSAMQPQGQTGTQVLPSHHKTSLQSALYLPYLHDTMSTVLRGCEVNKNSTNDIAIPDDVIENDFKVTAVEIENDEMEKESSQGRLCGICPVEVRVESPKVVSSSSGQSSGGSNSPGASDGSASSRSERQEDSRVKPFPYRVVAPWASDA